VLLALSIDVEVAEAGDLRGAVRPAAATVWSNRTGIGVDIERRFEFAALLEHAAAAIHRGGRSVQKRHFLVLAMV